MSALAYLSIIDRKRRDAIDFARIGSIADAVRLRAEILQLAFQNVRPRDLFDLTEAVKRATRDINAAIEGAEA